MDCRGHTQGLDTAVEPGAFQIKHSKGQNAQHPADGISQTDSKYFKVEGLEQDIFVNQRNTLNALNGDRVEVVVMHRGRNGSLEGEVTAICERAEHRYIAGGFFTS